MHMTDKIIVNLGIHSASRSDIYGSTYVDISQSSSNCEVMEEKITSRALYVLRGTLIYIS